MKALRLDFAALFRYWFHDNVHELIWIVEFVGVLLVYGCGRGVRLRVVMPQTEFRAIQDRRAMTCHLRIAKDGRQTNGIDDFEHIGQEWLD